MYYKQKLAQQNHNLDSLHSYQQPANEERKLLALWNQHAVEQSYQNIVLAYLDQFTDPQQLTDQIKKELKLTYTKSTHFFKIRNLLAERNKAIRYLYEWAVMLQQYKKLTQRDQPDLNNVCHLLDHLRKVHMLVCETVSEMFLRYKCSLKRSHNVRAASYYLNIFATFNDELQFLKDSLLKFYMPFSSGFDPLLLKAAQNIGKLYAEDKIVYDADVEALFHVNASYLYRLLRANQRMLEYLSISQQGDDYDDTINLKGHHNHTIEEDKIQVNPQRKDLATPPARKQQRPVQTEPHKQSRLVQTDPMLILQSTKPSRMQQYLNSNQQQKIKDMKRNDVEATQTTANQEVKPPARFNFNLQTQNDSPNTPLDDRLNPIKMLKQERQRQTTNPSTPSRKPQSQSQRISTEGPKGITNPTKRFYRQREFSHQDTPDQYHPKRIPQKRKSQFQIYVAEPIKRNSLNNKPDKFNLPKINQTLKNNKDADCFCRQKYKSKRPQRYEQEPQNQMTSKRKSIIRLINAKYRRLAQRQKRYELNKIRDQSQQKSREESRVTKMRGTNELSDNSRQKSSRRP